MYSKQHKTAKNSANASDTSASNQFAPRSFIVQPQVKGVTTQKDQTVDLEAKPDKFTSVGNGLLDTAIFTRNQPPSRPPKVQMRPMSRLGGKHLPKVSADVVQRAPENISGDEEKVVSDRAQKPLSEEDIKGYGANQKDKALVARDTPSMAQNPAFEQAAQQWEDVFGGVAYNDPRAMKTVDDGAQKAVDYLTKKCGAWEEGNKALQAELAQVQIKDTGWSGGVGDQVADVMKAFTNGSLGVKIAHLENFCNKILAQDLLTRDEKGLEEILTAAKIDKDDLQDASARIKKSGSRYAMHDTKGPAADQWHMRAERNPKDKSQDISQRTIKDVEGLGMKLDPSEKSFMNISQDTDKLKWAEGARIWALNERDKWVFAMRQLSLPLAAGVSGTTARMMQSFSMLGVGNPADSRLACIAYLLPTHHHSLVEIMAGAAGNGGPAFSPGADMYRKIEPFTEQELRTKVGPFPDEQVKIDD
jgi:hypothetical protein